MFSVLTKVLLLVSVLQLSLLNHTSTMKKKCFSGFTFLDFTIFGTSVTMCGTVVDHADAASSPGRISLTSFSLLFHHFNEYTYMWYITRSTTCSHNIYLSHSLVTNNKHTHSSSNIKPRILRIFIVSLRILLGFLDIPLFCPFLPSFHITQHP